MPRSTRDWAMRKLESANKTLDWFDYHLLEVAEKYCDAHREIAAPLVDISATTALLRKLVLRVKEKL
ncbi:hypothetical protein ES705_39874 [subsurface metagenome]